MNKKERTFEEEAPALENFGTHSRSNSPDLRLKPSGKDHRFPFSRDLIFRLIRRIEKK